MARSAFPGSAAHIAAHRSFRDQLAEVSAQVAAGRPVTGAALDVIGSSLRQHAKVQDAALARHLRAASA